MAARDLPPARSLIAFDAFVRCGTVRAAARELGVLPSTVSRQLAELEQAAGAKLLFTDGRTLKLTAEGRLFAERLARSLQLAEGAFRNLKQAAASPGAAWRPIRILAPAPLCAYWFAGRIAEWRSLNPEIEIRLHAFKEAPGWENLEFDIAIRTAPSGRSDFVNEFAAADAPTLTAPRSALAAGGKPARIWELFETLPLAVCRENLGCTEQWLADNGLRPLAQQKSTPCATLLEAAGAAAEGSASLVCPRLFVQSLLEQELLAEPWPHRKTRPLSWWISMREDSARRVAVRDFASYLSSEIIRSLPS